MTEKPEKCGICGGTEFWLRVAYGTPEFICETCHPEPKEE
uniref:Uncharacterized protein n=1 Tax=viral metagenome TaxID=1070528 RepID=A0A6M3LQL5_9ZZZZ